MTTSAEAEARGYYLEGELVITSPTTRRLRIQLSYGGTCELDGCEPLRLALLDYTEDDGSYVENALTFYDPNMHEVGRPVIAAWREKHSAKHGRRFGTWARYRDGVALAHQTIALLGWTLTAEEQTVMDALEAYGATQGRRAACLTSDHQHGPCVALRLRGGASASR